MIVTVCPKAFTYFNGIDSSSQGLLPPLFAIIISGKYAPHPAPFIFKGNFQGGITW